MISEVTVDKCSGQHFPIQINGWDTCTQKFKLIRLFDYSTGGGIERVRSGRERFPLDSKPGMKNIYLSQN